MRLINSVNYSKEGKFVALLKLYGNKVQNKQSIYSSTEKCKSQSLRRIKKLFIRSFSFLLLVDSFDQVAILHKRSVCLAFFILLPSSAQAQITASAVG